MARVRFGDVVKEIKINIDRATDNHEFYIAGEHMETENIHLTKRGRFEGSDVGPAFIRLFRPGQILYGSRRTYLKKVAVADFEGITSNTTFVLETKDQNVMMQELLPFIMLTDSFTEYAIRNSKGSTNPYILFSDLCAYEFELPAIEEQRILTKRLLACDNVKEAYKHLIASTDELVKSQFVEMFGDVVENTKQWPIHRLEEIATSRLGKMLDAKKQTGLYSFPYLANTNVQWFRFDLCDLRQMDFPPEDQVEFELQKGDLMVCEGGEVGRCAVWHNEITPCYFQKAIHRVRCNKDIILPEYLAFWFRCRSEYNAFEDVVGSITTIAHLPGVKLKNLNVVVPPVELQKQFVSIMEQTDKSKYVARQATSNLRTYGIL